MKIGVVGGGVSGSYIASLLSGRHDVVIYERQSAEKFYTVCAWGTSIHELRRLSSRIGMDFDEYVYFTGRRMIVQVGEEEMEIKLKGLCTFDKRRFVQDMHQRNEVVYGAKLNSRPSSPYDLIVDATGFHRALLPRIQRDYYIPTLEYKVRYRDPPLDDFYIRPLPGMSGYLWYFPLEDGYAHVGAGDYYKQHEGPLRRFMERYPGEVEMRIGRPVRIAPPRLCQPILHEGIVGVGESIGVVYPALGEGIIPGMQCASILADHIEREDLEGYPQHVLREYDIYDKVFTFIKKKITGEFRWLVDFRLVLAAFIHMKMQEDRYGMEIRLRDWLRIVRSF